MPTTHDTGDRRCSCGELLVCPTDLRRRLDEVRSHPIGGYEWECSECHYHFSGEPCHVTGAVTTVEAYVDSQEQRCDHHDLVDRARVNALIA